MTLRSREDALRFFGSLDLAAALGVVSCLRWRPDVTGFGDLPDAPHFCSIARKQNGTAGA